jgi:hypothetical protein
MVSDSSISPAKLVITGVSASVAECVTYPVDATKTRLQLQGELQGEKVRYKWIKKHV